MNARARLYLLGRRLFTFPKWETHYRRIEEGASELGEELLRESLEHARAHVPYYRTVIPMRISSVRPLESIPTLTKGLLSSHFEELKSDDLAARSWYLDSSGGSTGAPQTFVHDRDYQEWAIATESYYYRRFLGVEPEAVSKVVLWGSESDLLHQRGGVKPLLGRWLTQTTFLNSFKVSRETLREYARLINAKKPVFVKGYAGSLYELARVVVEEGFSLHSPRFVYSAAETLRPFMREWIENAFGCKVYDFYGSREVGPMAGECAQGKLHIFTFNNHLEIVDSKNQPVGPGEPGRVLVTTLHNRAMPLIRYDIGDVAVPATRCTCGSGLPALERIMGRVTDHFRTTAGDLVHGEYFTHLFYFRGWVREFQVLQRSLDEIFVYYVPRGSVAHSDVEDIESKIRLVMGEHCKISWEEVREVPRTPQGKFLFTRSLMEG